ncbi:hypothetical protein KAR91_19895 [Candidatus Pacearchaeota archaeon]|nr:hypothetical protein [Candidatus Pacearchaeota archaeon]
MQSLMNRIRTFNPGLGPQIQETVMKSNMLAILVAVMAIFTLALPDTALAALDCSNALSVTTAEFNCDNDSVCLKAIKDKCKKNTAMAYDITTNSSYKKMVSAGCQSSAASTNNKKAQAGCMLGCAGDPDCESSCKGKVAAVYNNLPKVCKKSGTEMVWEESAINNWLSASKADMDVYDIIFAACAGEKNQSACETAVKDRKLQNTWDSMIQSWLNSPDCSEAGIGTANFACNTKHRKDGKLSDCLTAVKVACSDKMNHLEKMVAAGCQSSSAKSSKAKADSDCYFACGAEDDPEVCETACKGKVTAAFNALPKNCEGVESSEEATQKAVMKKVLLMLDPLLTALENGNMKKVGQEAKKLRAKAK